MPRKKNTRNRASKPVVNSDTLRRKQAQTTRTAMGASENANRRFRPVIRPHKFPGRLGGR